MNTEIERDRAWMNGYLQDQVGNFQEIYLAYSGRVYSYLRRRLRNADDLEEVFQKIWMKFHQSRKSWSPEYPILQWLFVISRSVLTDHFRFEAHRDQGLVSLGADGVTSGASVEAGSVEEEADKFRLEGSFGKKGLIRGQMEVVWMHDFEEEDYVEIAQRLGKSPISIRKTFSRALKRLRSAG